MLADEWMWSAVVAFSVVVSAGRTVNLVAHHGPEHIDLGCGPGAHCGEDAGHGGKSDVQC